MADEYQNEPNFLDTLLTLSPEQVLATFHVEMRRAFTPIEGGLDILTDPAFDGKDADELLEMMKRNSTAMRQMLDLMLSYLKARQDMKNADDKTSE